MIKIPKTFAHVRELFLIKKVLQLHKKSKYNKIAIGGMLNAKNVKKLTVKYALNLFYLFRT